MGGRKSLREKMSQEPKIVDIPPRMQKRFGKGKMLIPSPLEIDALIRKVGEGALVTSSQIREKLAENHKAKVTCPLTTGIFLRIVAEAAEESSKKGKKEITPYWRVLTKDGNLNPKFPGGIERQSRRLKKEGHKIEPSKGKKPPKVEQFERYLQPL